MIFHRHWIALLVAGGLCSSHWLRAQDASGSTSSSSGSSDAGASSSFGSGSSSSGGTSGSSSLFDTGTPSSSSSPFGSSLFDTGTSPSSSTAAPNIFGTNPTGTAPPASGTPNAASTFGSGAAGGGGPTVQREAAPSFTLPGAYGQAAQSFTLGEGRLARPRFSYSASVNVGYDDNTLQTPTNPQGFPEVSVEEIVELGRQAGFEKVPVVIYKRQAVPGTENAFIFVPEVINVPVFRKAKPPKTEKRVLQEAIPPQERAGSFFTRASANYQITFGTRRTIFTMDLRGNADYYFSRPKDQTDFTGSLAFNFLHRITPRMQFSATANIAYLSQPDVRLINGPTRNVGDYFSVTSKFDLSYRWTKRFTTVTSFSFNSLLYSQSAQEGSNNYEGILGTEARYTWSPRLTLLLDLRYGQTYYPQNSLLNSSTLYTLLGAEYILSKRISTSLRLGESFRSFDTGGSTATPYLESTVSWRYNPVGFLSWNTRFGFEESGSPDAEVLSLRTGLSAVQAFSSRLRGSAGLTYVHRTTTVKSTGFDAAEQTFELNAGLEYAVSKRFSLNASYTFTTTVSDSEVNDYYRNRIFFGAEYSF